MRVSVIVTIARRGSLTSCSSVEATIWEIRLASLRARGASAMAGGSSWGSGAEPWGSVVVRAQPAGPRGEHLELGVGGHQALAVVEHVGDVPGVGRHRRDPDEGAAVQVEMARPRRPRRRTGA